MKKKVLFVAHHLTIGGVQKSLISALKALDYENNDVTLYLRKNRLDLLPYVDKRVNVIINDDQTRYYALPKSILFQLKAILFELFRIDTENTKKQLADFIRQKQFEYEKQHYFSDTKYDVAVSYLQGYEALFVNDIVEAGKKIVFYQSSTDETHEAHEKCLHKFDVIAVEHPDVMKMLLSCYTGINQSLFKIIENYTDSDFILEQAKEVKIPKEKFTIVTVGRISEIKGFDLAVEAARILRDKGLDFQWYFVGDGPDRGIVEALIKDYDLQDRITLTGMQKNPYPFVYISDIFVQPSREEAMSIAVLEAQVLCKPVVTTKTVGGMNIVKDGVTGAQVDIDPDSIAKGVMKLINEPEIVESMVNVLKKIDYTAEKERYRHDWAELLEG